MSAGSRDDERAFEIELPLLLEAIFRRYHHDFRCYAASSMRRRLGHALSHLGVSSLSALQERVLRDPASFDALFPYLTVSVSDMFRDPTFFRALRERVFPHLATYPSLKIWVAGASTGEEVYSLAICLHEAGLLARTTLYATDIDTRALTTAEAGVYALERVAGFSSAYLAAGGTGSLSDYYTAGSGSVIFDRALRRGVVFADHSLATDGVFAEVQLVTCRNVLIYFDKGLQERAVTLFRDALCPRGFLGLGGKETLRATTHEPAFSEFVGEERIYRKR
jgi:chemotaxis protein methyltransferase CheR